MSETKLELGQFIHWDRGQNYPFGACMSKLIECLGGDTAVYDYDFFAGLSGDDFVMCYGDNENFNDCLSVCADTEAFLSRVCGAIDLEYRFVKRGEWIAEQEKFFDTVKNFIDRKIPVLCAGVGKNANYNLLLAYDDETKKCRLSCGDDAQYGMDIPFGEMECDLVFIEKLPQVTDISAVYRKAVADIPVLMTEKPTVNGVYFGAEAYGKWATDITGGRYDRYNSENFDGWQHWSIYICNVATNGSHGEAFLRRAYELNPDLTFVPKIIALFHENENVWHELESLGGGFDCSLETLHDKAKAAKIAKTVSKLVETNEEIVKNIICK